MLDAGAGIDAVAGRPAAASGNSLYDPALFAGPHPFQAEEQAVRDDYQRYLADLAEGRVRTLAIPAQDGGDPRPVSLLTVRDPSQRPVQGLGAARPAARARPGRGFVMTSVQYGNERFVISVDPAAGVWLKGLGAALDQAETIKRRRTGPGTHRPGAAPASTMPTPGTMAALALYNYTIVDAPRAGTVLTAAEVAAIVEHPGRWMIKD